MAYIIILLLSPHDTHNPGNKWHYLLLFLLYSNATHYQAHSGSSSLRRVPSTLLRHSTPQSTTHIRTGHYDYTDVTLANDCAEACTTEMKLAATSVYDPVTLQHEAHNNSNIYQMDETFSATNGHTDVAPCDTSRVQLERYEKLSLASLYNTLEPYLSQSSTSNGAARTPNMYSHLQHRQQ